MELTQVNPMLAGHAPDQWGNHCPEFAGNAGPQEGQVALGG